MSGQCMVTRYRSAFLWAAVLLTLILPGCQSPAGLTGQTDRAPTPLEVAQMDVHPEVINVAAFYSPHTPWIWSQDKTRVEGIMVGATYLLGPDGKGVFGDGVIHPKLYVVRRDLGGRRKAVLAKEWSFDVEQAILLRAKRRRDLGWGYGLPLCWGDLDLAGCEIMMVITFDRPDGLVVSSDEKYFHVPKEPL